jgi:hypothetical protein
MKKRENESWLKFENWPLDIYIRIIKHYTDIDTGLTKPGEVGDFFVLVSMKSPNLCQKAKF